VAGRHGEHAFWMFRSSISPSPSNRNTDFPFCESGGIAAQAEKQTSSLENLTYLFKTVTRNQND
jgi:hypothetical protein